MNASMRKFVTGPDGRRWRGRWPQSMPTTGEGPFIAALATMLDGACEVVLPVGRADAATSTTVFEVEPARSWRTGLRQVLGYAGQTGLNPALALFGPADYLEIFLFLRDRLPNVQMWAFRRRWQRITSRKTATLKHHAYYDEPPRIGAISSVSVSPPQPHRFDHLVPADVTDPWERVRRAGIAQRLRMAELGRRSAAKRASSRAEGESAA